MSWICPCGASNDEDNGSCRRCGYQLRQTPALEVSQPVTKMFCANCGKPLVPGTRFCGQCGAVIADSSATSRPLSAWHGVLIAVGLLLLFCGLGAFQGKSATSVAVLVVLTTTVWACIDSYQIRRHYKAKDTTVHPVGLFFLLVGVWIITFPWYVVERSRVLANVQARHETPWAPWTF